MSALWTPARDSRSKIGASCRLSESVAISRPLPCIIAASASVLPPAPAQRSITCSPGLAAENSAASCEPSSCTSIAPLMKSSSDCTPGIAGVGGEIDAQAERRPRRRPGVQMRQRGQHLLGLGLQRVDAQVERRAARHRGRLRHPRRRRTPRPSSAIEPFRIVAGHRRRRVGERARGQRGPLGLGERLPARSGCRRTAPRSRRHRARVPA